MLLVGITLFLILIGLGFFVYGALALSKYAFRLGTGPGLMTLLFPPYTVYFAVFKLEEDGKSWPTAAWAFGLIITVLLTFAFWPDLSALMHGDMERFKTPPAAASAEGDDTADEAPSDDAVETADNKADQPADDKTADNKADQPADGAAAAKDGADAKSADGATAAKPAAAKPADAKPADGATAAKDGAKPAAGN